MLCAPVLDQVVDPDAADPIPPPPALRFCRRNKLPKDPPRRPLNAAQHPLARRPPRDVHPPTLAPSAPTDQPPASSTPVLAPTFRPLQHDCDPGGAPPRVCVTPSETEGAPTGSGGCREATRAPICRGCRVVFSKLEAGRCCYVGLSRFPSCGE